MDYKMLFDSSENVNINKSNCAKLSSFSYFNKKLKTFCDTNSKDKKIFEVIHKIEKLVCNNSIKKKKLYKCPYCDRKFEKIYDYNNSHINIHISNKKYNL